MGHFYPKAGTFGAFMQAHGIADFNVLDKKLKGSPGGSVARKLHGDPKTVAPNTPMLEFVAKAIGVDVPEIAAFAFKAPLEQKWVNKLNLQIRNNTIPRGRKHSRALKAANDIVKKGKRLVLVPKVKGMPKARVTRVPEDGRLSAKGNGRLSRKEQKLVLRDTVRNLFTSVNLGIMLGQKKMPELPLKDLRMVLVDYAEMKGFPGGMLIEEGFAEAFE